jgi:Uncharacterised nucleotidyltransferase
VVTTKLELFRILSSFSPPRAQLSRAPWDEFVNWSIAQGLAPLAAYNLEYRLGSSGSPEWARDRLLSIYQGTANDNVMKLVNLKQQVDELQGRKLTLVGSATFAESLYPHVAFRPVIDIRMALPRGDLEGFANYLRRAEFTAQPEAIDRAGAERVLNDTRTQLFLHAGFSGHQGFDAQVTARLLPMKVYGSSMYRLDLEDALVVHILLMARAQFVVPMIEFVDLRELVLEAPSMGGVYSRPINAALVAQSLSMLKLERAAYAALSILTQLFPETAAAVQALRPQVPLPMRELLDSAIVKPVSDLDRQGEFGFEEKLRQLLLGADAGLGEGR